MSRAGICHAEIGRPVQYELPWRVPCLRCGHASQWQWQWADRSTTQPSQACQACHACRWQWQRKDNCSTTQPSQACTNTVRIKHTVTHARNERRAFGGGSEQDVLAFVAAAAMRPYSGGHLHVPRRRGQHTKTETVSCRAESVASRSIMITASGNVAAWIRARF